MKRILVRVPPKAYAVTIGSGLLRQSGAELKRLFGQRTRVFVVTNPTVWEHWGPAVAKSLAAAKMGFEMVSLPDGEQYKNLASIGKLAEQMASLRADRTSAVLALGGGVVGDVAGFLAAVYMRGIPVVQVPTTLLAQVDASVGGKTGVNLVAGKNLVGSFHQPRAVWIDPDLLSTLPDREFRAGLFEVIKCGVIRSPQLFAVMEESREKVMNRDSKLLGRIIAESVAIKARVVEADEKEGGLRRILNFGHTVGHALESVTGYTRFLHGEAVGWGMIAAATISSESKISPMKTAGQIQSVVAAYGLPGGVNVSTGELFDAIAHDKKTVHGIPHFVLPTRIGAVKIANNISRQAVIAGIERMKSIAAEQEQR